MSDIIIWFIDIIGAISLLILSWLIFTIIVYCLSNFISIIAKVLNYFKKYIFH